jgi:hypothetical protein
MSVSLSASGENVSPAFSSRAAMKASIGFFSVSASFSPSGV